MTITPEMRAAYESAQYHIDCPSGPILRRVGLVDAQADAALRAAGCRKHWAIVTPCNPMSRDVGEEVNRERLERFVAQVQAAGWRSLPSRNEGEDGSWPEPGRCLLDVEPGQAAALGRQWEQAAILTGRLGAAPEVLALVPVQAGAPSRRGQGR